MNSEFDKFSIQVSRLVQSGTWDHDSIPGCLTVAEKIAGDMISTQPRILCVFDENFRFFLPRRLQGVSKIAKWSRHAICLVNDKVLDPFTAEDFICLADYADHFDSSLKIPPITTDVVHYLQESEAFRSQLFLQMTPIDDE